MKVVLGRLIRREKGGGGREQSKAEQSPTENFTKKVRLAGVIQILFNYFSEKLKTNLILYKNYYSTFFCVSKCWFCREKD